MKPKKKTEPDVVEAPEVPETPNVTVGESVPSFVAIAASPLHQFATLHMEKPPAGDYRMVLALINDHGHIRWADFTIGPEVEVNLTERSMFERYFYPALLRLKGQQ